MLDNIWFIKNTNSISTFVKEDGTVVKKQPEILKKKFDRNNFILSGFYYKWLKFVR